jgi:hypothetical protein
MAVKELYLELSPVLDQSALEELRPSDVCLSLVEFAVFGIVCSMPVMELWVS